jgi:hypothetical protein
MAFATVKAGDILEVVYVSLAAAVFISVAFSLVVLGSSRSAEARRAGHGTAALVWGGTAVVAFAVFAVAVGLGVHIMLSKG